MRAVATMTHACMLAGETTPSAIHCAFLTASVLALQCTTIQVRGTITLMATCVLVSLRRVVRHLAAPLSFRAVTRAKKSKCTKLYFIERRRDGERNRAIHGHKEIKFKILL